MTFPDTFRLAYAALFLATAAQTFPSWRRFFADERWGGYREAGNGWFHSPSALRVVLAAWLVGVALIGLGVLTVPLALLSCLLCHHFFIRSRWNSLLRGMGAPGFLLFWLSAAVFLWELTLRHAPRAVPLALFALQFDFALVMLTAGISKFTSGYRRNEGIEYGLANPMWGYWWKAFSRAPAGSRWFTLLDQGAWLFQCLGAVLLFFPATRAAGAVFFIATFAAIGLNVRLGFLCEQVMLAACLCLAPSAPGLLPGAATAAELAVAAALWAYLGLRCLATAGLWYNFYARRPLPALLQRPLDAFCNVTGVQLWRVFTADQLDFHVEILRGDAPLTGPRWKHVGESIALTTIFTGLKYFPGDADGFRRRLLRYARTLPGPAGEPLRFRYVSIQKRGGRFAHVPVAEFLVDGACTAVTESTLDPGFDVRRVRTGSAAHPCARPGSFAPALPSPG